MKSNRIFIAWLRWPLYVRIAIIICFLLLFFGQLIVILEPKQYHTIFDGIWWALITVATVGYGDFVPQTIPGQIAGMALILIGASFVTAYFATLAAAVFSKQHHYVEGKVAFKGKGHLIIVGWNEKTNKLLQSFQTIDPAMPIVLIDDSLKEGPLLENVHFIKGHGTEDATLRRANIMSADTLMITADQHENEVTADMQSVLTLLAAKGLNPSLYCLIEILTDRYVKNAERAGANQVIHTSDAVNHLMVEHFLLKEQLMALKIKRNMTLHKQITIIPVPASLAGETFLTALHHFLEHHVIIVGVQKKEGPMMNPPFGYELHPEDELISF
ncbi:MULTISPECIES: potassium channel family protein [Bacillus]|uniref:potassium channel family protein n=1 Tax=Bacillus TaxID=1386 RepID=UPI0002EA54CA|nr:MULTISPECIES: potassium channel family protein [Bacillus]ANT57797.1 potassium channel protein [Bacillus pumilus]MBY0185841.1 NAD-binding protein [Bacillus aerophilus]KKK11573.1 potassium channel protein [Bacillus sp. L_1B0_12]KSU74838.1 potassium channel protein [Bacillus altitudinis]MCY7498762.1 potassium channel family protein [Bacillus altitudinis]